jgi:hypothetical protein
MRHWALKGVLLALVLALIPALKISADAAGPQSPACGNYKVVRNEVITGVKFAKGTYQINTFGISCAKVMGSKGLFAQFLKLKDKDPLPKPWRYLADAIGAPKFSSGAGVGFRVQLIGAMPTKSPTPTPTAIGDPEGAVGGTPSPTPTPTPTPTLTTSPITKVPTSFDDLVENYKGIAYAAWSKSREKILASKKTEVTLKMVMGPTSKLTYKEPLIPIELITRMYAGYVEPIEIYYLAFNFEDRNWAVDQMENILPNSGSRWITETACRTRETCWGGGSFYNGTNRYLIVVTVELLIQDHLDGTLEAHEFMHVLQHMNIKKGRPAQEFLYDPWPPTWYWEGQAHFSQHAAMFHENFTEYLKYRNHSLDELRSNPRFTSELLETYFVFNAPEAWQKNFQPWYQYSIGALLVEVLTALKGPDSAIEIWKITGTGVDFKTAFERVYGISFEKALPVIAKAIALQLGHS